MSKEEEYKKQLVKEFSEKATETPHPIALIVGFVEGFETHSRLELPIKFVQWINSHNTESEKARMWILAGASNTKELYEYWINNVYKP